MREKRGMTFIELLVAMFVFMIAIVGIMSSIAAVFKIVDDARERTVAVTDVSNLMEKMRATAFSSLTSNFPNGMVDGPTANRYPVILGGYTLRNETITVTYPNVNADPLEINATVDWRNKQGRNFTISMATLRTQ